MIPDQFDQIVLSAWQIALVALLSAAIVWYGRSEIALGIYMSMALWTRAVMIGPVVHTWFFMAVTICAIVAQLHRTRRVPGESVPARYRWIVPWMFLWWLWMAVEITLFDSPEKRALFRNLTCYVMFPLPVALLIAHERVRLGRFAYAHIVTTLIGGLFAFDKLGLDLAYLAGDPTLSHTTIVRLNIANYHWFAYGYAVSLILATTLYLRARRARTCLALGLVAAANLYMLFLSGSRQALNGSAILVVLMCLWALGRSPVLRARALLLFLPGAVLGIALYLAAPQLIVRPGEGSFFDTLDVAGDRGGLWVAGLEYFYTSPLWGAGFEHTNYAHNVVIGALADQGLVGLVFLAGTLAFFVQRCRGIWRRQGDLAIWQLGFAMVGCFSLITGLVSSDTLSIWYFYLAGAVLWCLGQPNEDWGAATAGPPAMRASPAAQPTAPHVRA